MKRRRMHVWYSVHHGDGTGAWRGMWCLSVLLCCAVSKHCWQVLEVHLPALLLPPPCYSDGFVFVTSLVSCGQTDRQAAGPLAVMIESFNREVVCSCPD